MESKNFFQCKVITVPARSSRSVAPISGRTSFFASCDARDFVAQTLRDWCDASDNIRTAYIEPGSQWKKGFAVSYQLCLTSSTTDDSAMNSSPRCYSPLLRRLNSCLSCYVTTTIRSPMASTDKGVHVRKKAARIYRLRADHSQEVHLGRHESPHLG